VSKQPAGGWPKAKRPDEIIGAFFVWSSIYLSGRGTAVRTGPEVGRAVVVVTLGLIAEMIIAPTTKIASTANMMRIFRCARI
jgi:hypothetical protein